MSVRLTIVMRKNHYNIYTYMKMKWQKLPPITNRWKIS